MHIGPGISLLLLGTADNHSGKRLVLATSNKPQASSLTAGPGYDRMDLERINYDTTRHRYKSISTGENSKRFRRDPAPGEGRSGTNEKIK